MVQYKVRRLSFMKSANNIRQFIEQSALRKRNEGTLYKEVLNAELDSADLELEIPVFTIETFL